MKLRSIGSAELAGADLVGEEHVQFTISTSLWFWETEEGPDDTEGVEAEPEETGLGAPVPGGGVEHVGDDDTVDDTEHVVDVSGEHDGFGTETGG